MDDSFKEIYEKLIKYYRQENASPELSDIDVDFYTKVNTYISKLKEKIKHTESFDARLELERQYENMMSLFNVILDKRISKIVEIARLNEEPPKMTSEEEVLFSRIQGAIHGFRELVGIKEDTKKEDNSSKTKLKILKYVEEYVSNDKTYGPFNPGQIVEIEKEEGEWLIGGGYAERVE